MRLISSKTTFFSKRVFPFIWFGFLALFIVLPFVLGNGKNRPPPFFFVVPCAMAVFGFFIMKKLVFDLADAVWDDGDALVVRKKGWDERIPLTNIINVSTGMSNPPRITLTLRDPCRFGKEVAFSPPVQFFQFWRSKVAADLIERIEAKRRG
jgi:hypothetical protein